MCIFIRSSVVLLLLFAISTEIAKDKHARHAGAIHDMEPSKYFAFVSPQGNMILEDLQYQKMQGSTAENGGQVIYVIELARALVQEGHRVDIFARQYHSSDLKIEEENGICIFHIPTAAPPYVEKEDFYPYYPEYLAGMIGIIDRQAGSFYDAIVGHYADGMLLAAGLGRYIKRKSGRRVPLLGVTHSLALEKAYSIHETLKKNNSTDYTRNYNAILRRFNIHARLGCELAAMAEMDAIICISNKQKDILSNDYNFPEERITIIPGGITSTLFYPRNDIKKEEIKERLLATSRLIPPNSLSAIHNSNIIFAYGRIVKAKGILNAVQSLELLLHTYPNLVYLYAGGNVPPSTREEEDILKEVMDYATSRGYATRIIFLGHQDQNTIAKWLSISDVYLHTATLEPFGLAPLEAAAAGVPSVISKYAGVADLLHHNVHSLHADSRDIHDISKKVANVLEDHNLRKYLTSNAAEVISRKATWPARARSLLEFLSNKLNTSSLLHSPPRSARNMFYTNTISAIYPQQISTKKNEFDTAHEILDSLLLQGLTEKDNHRLHLHFDCRPGSQCS